MSKGRGHGRARSQNKSKDKKKSQSKERSAALINEFTPRAQDEESDAGVDNGESVESDESEDVEQNPQSSGSGGMGVDVDPEELKRCNVAPICEQVVSLSLGGMRSRFRINVVKYERNGGTQCECHVARAGFGRCFGRAADFAIRNAALGKYVLFRRIAKYLQSYGQQFLMSRNESDLINSLAETAACWTDTSEVHPFIQKDFVTLMASRRQNEDVYDAEKDIARWDGSQFSRIVRNLELFWDVEHRMPLSHLFSAGHDKEWKKIRSDVREKEIVEETVSELRQCCLRYKRMPTEGDWTEVRKEKREAPDPFHGDIYSILYKGTGGNVEYYLDRIIKRFNSDEDERSKSTTQNGGENEQS